jgi:hypothetical protein
LRIPGLVLWCAVFYADVTQNRDHCQRPVRFARLGPWVILGRISTQHLPLVPDRPPSNSATMLKPGPWGTLDSFPMDIAAPVEILPLRTLEESQTHWFFGGFTPDELSEEYIVPSVFNKQVARRVARAVEQAARRTGVARRQH